MRIVTLANKNTDMYLQRVKIQKNQGKDQKKKKMFSDSSWIFKKFLSFDSHWNFFFFFNLFFFYFYTRRKLNIP